MENIDIFITAFKDYTEYVTDKRYKVVCVNDYNYNGELEWYKDNVGDNISDMNWFYNELTTFYWVWKNYKMKDYVGMCSYRRYFNFFNDIDSVEDILKTYDIIVPSQTELNQYTNKEFYEKAHNLNDLLLLCVILLKKNPSYKDSVYYVMNNNKMYANNMFIMKSEDYIKYCEFLFDILNEFLQIRGFHKYEDAFNYIDKHSDEFYKFSKSESKINYQTRIGGFLAERLFTIYVHHNFKNIYETPISFIEDGVFKKVCVKNNK